MRRPPARPGDTGGNRPTRRSGPGADEPTDRERRNRSGAGGADAGRGGRHGTDRARQLRRRLDTLVLRVQGRFDSDWSDRVLPWLCAGALFVMLTALASAQVRSMLTPVDYAAAVQSIWLIHQGVDPVVTLTTGQHALAAQVAVVLYPISLVAYVLPIGPSLVMLQSGALSLAVVPIWRLCRKLVNLRVGTSLCVIAAYSLYPAVHSLNLAGFHPETLALPALLYAACFGLARRWRRFGLCCLLVVLCRADLGLAVAGLGALVWASGRKVEGRVAVGIGLAYTVIAVLLIEPHFAGGAYPHLGAHAAFGDTPASVVWGMISHPADVVGALVREQNFELAARMLAPLAFLPLLAPRYLLPVAPVAFLYLTSDSPGATVYGEQTVALVAFAFLALAFALGRVGRAGPDRVRVDRWVLVVLLLAVVVSFGREGVSSPYRRPWGWGGRDLVDLARIDAGHLVGADRSVRASPTVAAELAERRRVYQLAGLPRPDPAAVTRDVDAVVLDATTVPSWTPEDHEAFRTGLEARGFRRVSDDEGIEVYLRGGV